MARVQRIVVPGQALHIVQRGNNRQPVFLPRRITCFLWMYWAARRKSPAARYVLMY